ncbi:MAG: hypothetical protein M1347_04380 [Chloroflexi bacterium]|nr:hypothetical protein [Chloroflexota bacterium]
MRRPLESVQGEYQFTCALESVTTLDPASYITVADQVITVAGQCSYLANGVKQTITIALGEGFTPGGVVTSTFDGTDEAYANFATTGDPLELGNFLVPLGVEQTGNVAE